MSAYIFSNAPLQAPPHPVVGTDARYCASFETHFSIAEEYMSFSHDDFRITDVNNGQVPFLVSGKTVSLREQKSLHDAVTSAPIWIMKKNLLKFVGRNYLFTHPVTNAHLFTIKNHHRWFANQGKKLTATLADSSIVTLEASRMDKLAVVTLTTGTNTYPIARIQRPLHSVRNVIGNVQDYDVTIAANVDISIIIAMVICLDEEGERTDKSQRNGGGMVLPGSSAAQSAGQHNVLTGMSSPNYVNATKYPQYYRPGDLDATTPGPSGTSRPRY